MFPRAILNLGNALYRAASTTPSSTAVQWAPAAATTWPCQMARENCRRRLTWKITPAV